MIAFGWISLALAVIAFQSLSGASYEVAGARPDFVVALFAVLAFRDTRRAVFIAACVAGLLLDLVTVDPFGVHLLSLGILLLVVSQATRGGLGIEPWARALLTAVVIASVLSARPLLVWLFGGVERSFASLPLSIVLTTAYAWALAPFLARFIPTGLPGYRARFR